MAGEDEIELRHVISVAVSEIDELPGQRERFVRTLRIKTMLGSEFRIELHSESRLALNIERARDQDGKVGLVPTRSQAVPPEEQA